MELFLGDSLGGGNTSPLKTTTWAANHRHHFHEQGVVQRKDGNRTHEPQPTSGINQVCMLGSYMTR